jgi:Domain of unknown function (DUF4328)
MLDVWVCGSCHSINRERDARCYRCHEKRSGAPDESGRSGSERREERAIVARITNPVRSSLELGVLAALLILIVVGLEVRTTMIELQAAPAFAAELDRIAAGGSVNAAALDAAVVQLDQNILPTVVAFGAALLAFAAWLAICVGNIPGLGGGTPSISPMWAFVSTVVPFLTFRRVPRILQEVLYRSDPRGGGVLILVVAWIGLIGSWIAIRLVNVYIGTRIDSDAANSDSVAELAGSIRSLFDKAVLVDVAFTVMIVVGAIALLGTMATIERRTAARNREIEAALGPVEANSHV